MSKIACKCNGFNEECIFCGGSGEVQSRKIEVLKTEVTEAMLTKERNDLDMYLNNKAEKMYESNPKLKRKKKRKQTITIRLTPPLPNETKKNGCGKHQFFFYRISEVLYEERVA